MDRSLTSSEGSVAARESPKAGARAEVAQASASTPRSRNRERAAAEPTARATALGVVLALGLHATVFAMAPRQAAMAATERAEEVKEVEVAIFLTDPPPP